MSNDVYSILIAVIKAIALGGGGIILLCYGTRYALGVKTKKGK